MATKPLGALPAVVVRERVEALTDVSPFMEVPTEPGVSSLKELDSNKLKAEIKRWAKAVVGYARQLSGRLGRSSRKSNRYGSSRSSSSHAA
ncbi:hypothetical protein HRI_003606700 [Hibiscus trionum]|uniref:Uncharacterized protein n=1 Tax=Hibiscus trionum TaxID=183268 RepID=A0A9W7IMN3_HIBTR|nr:hypothetical protein HRI_003606700 [Hibiscus trionum]